MNTDELHALKQRYEERWARWNGKIILIEKVFIGPSSVPRVKIIDDDKIRYLNLCDVTPF